MHDASTKKHSLQMKRSRTCLTEESVLSAGIWFAFKEGEAQTDKICVPCSLSRVCEAYTFF